MWCSLIELCVKTVTYSQIYPRNKSLEGLYLERMSRKKKNLKNILWAKPDANVNSKGIKKALYVWGKFCISLLRISYFFMLCSFFSLFFSLLSFACLNLFICVVSLYCVWCIVEGIFIQMTPVVYTYGFSSSKLFL